MAFLRNLGLALILLTAFAAAWFYGQSNDTRETFAAQASDKIITLDGDSFRIDAQEFRLEGIDAPEYRQVCSDKTGKAWNCGKSARSALDELLRHSGLKCMSRARDSFGRKLAICSTEGTPDIAASMVAAGLAISDEFNGVRSYGREEDAAAKSALGIWQGTFTDPKEWREADAKQKAAPAPPS